MGLQAWSLQSGPAVQHVLGEGYRAAHSEYFLERHLAATHYLTQVVAYSFFEALSSMAQNISRPLQKEWKADFVQAAQQVAYAFVSFFLTFPGLISPRWTFSWLVQGDAPILQVQVKALQDGALRLRKEKEALEEQLQMKQAIIDLLKFGNEDQESLVALNMELMQEMQSLRGLLAEKQIEGREEIDAHLGCLCQTVRLGAKVLGNPDYEMVLLQETGGGEILLKNPADWRKFVERISRQAKVCRAMIEDASGSSRAEGLSVQVRQTKSKRNSRALPFGEDGFADLRKLADSADLEAYFAESDTVIVKRDPHG